MKCERCDAVITQEELGVVLQGEDYEFTVCGKCLLELGLETDDDEAVWFCKQYQPQKK